MFFCFQISFFETYRNYFASFVIFIAFVGQIWYNMDKFCIGGEHMPTMEDIAKALGLRQGQTRTILYRMRRELKEELEKEDIKL